MEFKMELSKSIMQHIVEELRSTIGRDINIMDKTGRIIASTNTNRIGVPHHGAKIIIAQNLHELVISEDDSYAGTQRGINLPIIINEEIVGVVGITGDPQEVEPFGKIIKKMTEILIIEEYQKDQKQMIDRAKSNYVYSCLFDTIPEDELDEFILHGKLLGIDMSLQRAVVIIQISNSQSDRARDEYEVQELSQKLISLYKKNFNSNKQTVVTQIGTQIAILAPTNSIEELFNSMSNFKTVVEEQSNVLISGGIGIIASNISEIRQSYKEALNSCKLMAMLKNKGIKVYGDVDMELLLQTISKHTRIEYLMRIFKNFTDHKYNEVLTFLRTFFDNNGSILHTSEQLFIHKNTVQYRLNKIKEITGYDPRIITEMVPLYIALLIYELDIPD
ncbi:MAG: sugar diacid recognition domain-containing protein [Oscillospiraceae bacterium]